MISLGLGKEWKQITDKNISIKCRRLPDVSISIFDVEISSQIGALWLLSDKPHPPLIYFSLPFNYLLSWPCICSLVQKVFSTCSWNHFLLKCVQLEGGFYLSFGHDFNSFWSFPLEVAQYKRHTWQYWIFGELVSWGNEFISMLLFQILVVWSFYLSEFTLKLVWGWTKPCSRCYDFSTFVRKFKLFFLFWILSFGPREPFHRASQMWFDAVNCEV